MTAPEPLKPTPPWAYYRRTGLSEMRPYVPKEPLATISVSAPDMDTITRALTEGRDPGGYVARNPKNHADQWYVAQAYFNENLEPADTPARDEAAELRSAVLEWAEANARLEAADNAWGWAIDRGEEDVEYYATSWTHRVKHYRKATDKLLELAKSLRGERE